MRLIFSSRKILLVLEKRWEEASGNFRGAPEAFPLLVRRPLLERGQQRTQRRQGTTRGWAVKAKYPYYFSFRYRYSFLERFQFAFRAIFRICELLSWVTGL